MNTTTVNDNSRKARSQVLLSLVLALVLVTGSGVQVYSQETYSNENLPVLRYTANSDPTLIEKEPGIFLCVWDSSDDPVSKRTAIRFGILNLNEN